MEYHCDCRKLLQLLDWGSVGKRVELAEPSSVWGEELHGVGPQTLEERQCWSLRGCREAGSGSDGKFWKMELTAAIRVKC